MATKWIVYAMSIIQLGIISCSEDLKPTPYVYTKVFTGENSKTWKIKFFEQTLNGEINDTFSVNCSSDDLYTFYANSERTLQIKTGSKKCSSTEASVITDSWSFNNGSATLIMILPVLADFSLPMIVKEAGKNKMVLEIFLDAANTESYRIHFESTNEN